MRDWRRNRLQGIITGLAGLSIGLIAGCNHSNIAATAQDIDVSPNPIEYGKLQAGTGLSKTVSIRNNGGGTLIVDDIRVEPDTAPYVIHGTENGTRFEIGSGDTLELELEFAPHKPSIDDAELLITSNDPDEGTFIATLTGIGFEPTKDTHTQGEGNEADILFVVDNSGSMYDDQVKLANSFDTFINWITGHNISYHIAVTTTDMSPSGEQGGFVGYPRVIDNDTPNVVAAFQNNVKVGDTGDYIEVGFDAAVAALSYPMVETNNAGFFREYAKLYLVFVSDEDDQSEKDVAYYPDYFTALKSGSPDQVFFSAIAGDEPNGCSSQWGTAYESPRYHEIISLTNGLFGSLCDQDFGITLQNLAFAITEPSQEFFLAFVPDPDTLQVVVNGEEQGSDRWSYRPQPNSVWFEDAWVPADGATVEIHYDAIDEIDN